MHRNSQKLLRCEVSCFDRIHANVIIFEEKAKTSHFESKRSDDGDIASFGPT